MVKALISKAESFVIKHLYNKNNRCFAQPIILEICAVKDKLLSNKIPKSFISCTSDRVELARVKSPILSAKHLPFEKSIQFDFPHEIGNCHVFAQFERFSNASLKSSKPFCSVILT